MSVAGCLEFILCMGCARWACHRCSHGGSADSDSWSSAALTDFASVPRACRAILAVYETDLSRPRWAPKPHGYPVSVPSKRATRADTSGRCPPYLIYADAAAKEVVVAVRGLSLVKESDYKMLLDDRPGLQRYEEGYVHHGLWKAAVWLVNREGGLLRRMLREEGKGWRLVVAGHSLGAGVAALVAVLVVSNLEKFQGLERGSVRCYAVAPPRCMSLNLAVKYADVIHSVVLQDDFLPRTPTPLQHIFGSIFCLPCLLCFVCMRDTFVSEERKLKDPRRLYAPGRMFHIVERKFCRCGRLPPEVRTAIPVEGRFEHIVLSCNAITDHSIVSIEREAQKALDIMKEKEGANTTPPMQRRMERERSFQAEHNDAMEKALLLSLSQPDEPPLWKPTLSESQHQASSCTNSSEGSEWDGLVEKPFDENDEPEDLIMQNGID